MWKVERVLERHARELFHTCWQGWLIRLRLDGLWRPRRAPHSHQCLGIQLLRLTTPHSRRSPLRQHRGLLRLGLLACSIWPPLRLPSPCQSLRRLHGWPCRPSRGFLHIGLMTCGIWPLFRLPRTCQSLRRLRDRRLPGSGLLRTSSWPPFRLPRSCQRLCRLHDRRLPGTRLLPGGSRPPLRLPCARQRLHRAHGLPNLFVHALDTQARGARCRARCRTNRPRPSTGSFVFWQRVC
mmetsp:Transcript_103803/g.298222  ORF Transcript_103803/g.298222 Transcript_103803/m.298222 type:complete len:237 (+) Transcript_103803:415-1125(+)